MLTTKDKVEQFKRDCKSVKYYTEMIIVCNERIEEYDVILNGLGCPNGNTDPKCENARNPYASNKLEPLMKQDEVIRERNDYIRRINDVNRKLNMIVNPVERQMIVDLYMERKSYSSMADKYHFGDKSALFKHVNRVIENIV